MRVRNADLILILLIVISVLAVPALAAEPECKPDQTKLYREDGSVFCTYHMVTGPTSNTVTIGNTEPQWVFDPKPDITAYELSKVMEVFFGNGNWKNWQEKLTKAGAMRHFKQETR